MTTKKSPWAGPTRAAKFDERAITILISQELVDVLTKRLDGVKHSRSLPISMNAIASIAGATIAYYAMEAQEGRKQEFIDRAVGTLAERIRAAAINITDNDDE